MIGKSISHYEIIEKIGSGGMGIVYKAEDLKLDRFVALKFLPPHLTTSDEEKQRFIHEAKAASALQHNNICNIHEIDETEDGQLFICMDYYEGETLDNKIKDKPLPIDEANDISIQIAQGLAKAHEKEIVHRDIKPANIMLTKEGVVKVLDFGLVKLSTQTKLTKESTTLGTVSYMSPEQAKGEEVDYRTDIWSLGLILYEMLTGQLPFKGEYESAVIYSILNDTQEPVTGLRTGMPMELERIINKCLQKNPENRYQHVDELIVDLRNLKKESESEVIPYKDEEEMKRHTRKMIYMLLSIVILIIAGYFLMKAGETDGSGWENSIAVLPFDDLSPEGDQEWFCDDITDQIISALQNLRRIRVIGRKSVMQLKGSMKTNFEIGQELNVINILESSASKIGDRIRIRTKLIRSEDETYLWSESYDYPYEIDSIYAIYDDISEKIAINLLATLSPQEKVDLKTDKPSNTEAYEYYMRGRHFRYRYFSAYHDRGEKVSKVYFDILKSSEDMFKKSIINDPNYAPSYAKLVEVYNRFYSDFSETKNDSIRYLNLQKYYLDTAVQLDPNSSDVYYVKGLLNEIKNEYDEAFYNYKMAIKINPNIEDYYTKIGGFFLGRGCYNLSIKSFSKAIELNPVIQLYYRYRGYWYLYSGEYDKAEKDLKKALEIDNSHFGTNAASWLFLIHTKRYQEADLLLAQIEENFPYQNKELEYTLNFAVKGRREKAIALVKNQHINAKLRVYAILGMNNEFIDLMGKRTERCINIQGSSYVSLINNPFYDNIRSDPRFQEILAKHKEIYEQNLAKYGDIDL